MMMHSKLRFWIEVEDAKDFSHKERYVLLREEEFEELKEWLSLQTRLRQLPQTPQVHFWNMTFRSDPPYDA